MIDREQVLRDWSRVLSDYPVPSNLRDHQIDAMALLKQGKHVFLGKKKKNLSFLYVFLLVAVPTGSGKTLPQLATILTMQGLNIINWTNK